MHQVMQKSMTSYRSADQFGDQIEQQRQSKGFVEMSQHCPAQRQVNRFQEN